MSTTTASSSIRKKRSSFSLSSFRKPAPPAPAALPLSICSCGIGYVVVPTKRPTPQQSLPPDHPVHLPASAAASPKDCSLHTHMADFVDRLQQKQKSNPQFAEHKKVTSTPVAPVAPSHGIHPSAPVSSALHKFFNVVNFISSIMKKSTPAPRVLAMPNEAPRDTEVNNQEDKQYHYHCYIHHHHHHHYRYGHRPDEVGALLGQHRRHSESSEALHPYIPSLCKAKEDEDDDEAESPIETFLHTCSTQHSEDFLCGCYMQRKDQDSNSHAGKFATMGESVIWRKDQDNHADKFAMMGELVIKPSPELPRRFNSARTTRHSVEIVRREADLYSKTATTQRVPDAPSHSETYDPGYKASVLGCASDGGCT